MKDEFMTFHEDRKKFLREYIKLCRKYNCMMVPSLFGSIMTVNIDEEIHTHEDLLDHLKELLRQEGIPIITREQE